jgi:1-deoxy-D-xylulose-5-phosphate reductoisomerase
VVVLGATGSIGSSAREVARALPGEIQLVGLSSWQNEAELIAAAREFHPAVVCFGPQADLSRARAELPQGTKILQGEAGLLELAAWPEADTVLQAIVGAAGLRPALAAIEAGHDLAVAGKEVLVMAGRIVMAEAARRGVRILPVDSEHNAIFQCLEGREPESVARLHLTCSGGPLRELPASEFSRVTPQMALRHPTWQMGRKITVDSATLFNKGLEMIEARWLFKVGMDRIQVVIHPQSIVHSMVEFIDGSFLAQLSRTSMTFPIQFALTYPQRVRGNLAPINFQELAALEFSAPRETDFPALSLARAAGVAGGNAPAVLNAANELAVEAFLEERIAFPQIWAAVEWALEKIPFLPEPGLEALLTSDQETRALLRRDFPGFRELEVKKVAG